VRKRAINSKEENNYTGGFSRVPCFDCTDRMALDGEKSFPLFVMSEAKNVARDSKQHCL